MYRNLWNPSGYRTNRFGKIALNVLKKIDAPVDLKNMEACHRLKSVII